MQTFATKKQEIFTNLAARGIFGPIRNEMTLVETEFERQASSNIQVIDYLGDYLRSSGGKRVRPALLVLSNYAAGGKGNSERVIRMATVMEMIHTATLVHDDIIDNADLRRNRTTVNARFGNHTAVLMGDWLYMSAFETGLKERSLEILDILTSLTRMMTEGELIQLTMIGNIEITEEEYFDILKRKTAYLFAGCCEIGAILAGASAEQRAALRDFGMNLGIAFQLADDVLDFTAEESVIGKAAGADLLEGKSTHPLIRLCSVDPSVRSILENVMDSGVYTEKARNDIIRRLEEHNIVQATMDLAEDFAEAARKNLDCFAKSEYLSALDAISQFVVHRGR